MKNETQHTPGPENAEYWTNKKTLPQIILNPDCDSYLGFWTRNEAFRKQLDELRDSCYDKTEQYFVLESNDGTLRVANESLYEALKYMNVNRVLVHNRKLFVSWLGANEQPTSILVEYQRAIDSKDDYAKKVWERYSETAAERDRLRDALRMICNYVSMREFDTNVLRSMVEQTKIDNGI